MVSNSNQLDWDDDIGDACDDPVPMPEDIDGATKPEKIGAAVAFAGDFNGDGYGDYVIGSPGYSVPAAPPVKAIVGAGKAEIISKRRRRRDCVDYRQGRRPRWVLLWQAMRILIMTVLLMLSWAHPMPRRCALAASPCCTAVQVSAGTPSGAQ
ncbi:MAG: integrin alpha [Pseudomonadales bacterium]